MTAVQLRLDDDERERLDAYRRAHTDPPSRALAAKRLFREALFTVSMKSAHGISPDQALAGTTEAAR